MAKKKATAEVKPSIRGTVMQQARSVSRVSPRGLPSMTGYTFSRDEVNLLMPQYMLIRDAIEGEMAIKGIIGHGTVFPTSSQTNFSININMAKAKLYLPQPNPADTSAENNARYLSYVQRAVYYNATGRTLEGMTGQIFLRDPDKKIPTQLAILDKDADGSGKTLDQVANQLVRSSIAYGRGGVLVDYPVNDGPVTQQQVDSGQVRPVLLAYQPWQIINWRVETIGAQRVLTQLVLMEYPDLINGDGFSTTVGRQWRVLSLEPQLDGSLQHSVRLYREGDNVGDPNGTYAPRKADGTPFDYIPWSFVGSKDNDAISDKPLLYDLAVLNIAHYRNSADYEESCFIVGQPTPVFTGLDQNWVETVLKGQINLGSRGSIPLPVGATAALLQAKENGMPIEAMKLKELQMVALGAKIVQVQKVAKTATQQINETTSESSPLQTVSRNVSMAIETALGIAADFVGAPDTGIQYTLNTDFDLTSMTADDQNAVLSQYQSAGLTFSELRTVLRKAGTATLDDATALAQIKQGIKDGMIPDPAQAAKDAAQAAKQASNAGGPQPGAPRQQSAPGSTN